MGWAYLGNLVFFSLSRTFMHAAESNLPMGGAVHLLRGSDRKMGAVVSLSFVINACMRATWVSTRRQ